MILSLVWLVIRKTSVDMQDYKVFFICRLYPLCNGCFFYLSFDNNNINKETLFFVKVVAYHFFEAPLIISKS